MDTSSARFLAAFDTPIYTSALTGSNRMFQALGAAAIYQPSTTGFRAYLYMADEALSVADAQSRDWAINWHGVQNF
ncbi:hypothetical protein ACQEU8_00370 [Streptomyces sp. CA-250714]|uniref:hypothetical protein n=1 Tax=Streptomyces sp. CA-250714 TaxID=3240060 RepID=UPI003D8F84B7